MSVIPERTPALSRSHQPLLQHAQEGDGLDKPEQSREVSERLDPAVSHISGRPVVSRLLACFDLGDQLAQSQQYDLAFSVR
jgi:hypothetical protein